MIKAFRADDRLIHGQVQTQWISTYGVNRVMIIDSNVVRDPINVQILKLAKPAGIDLVICDEEKAMNLIAKDAAQPAARTFVIFKTIETAQGTFDPFHHRWPLLLQGRRSPDGKKYLFYREGACGSG